MARPIKNNADYFSHDADMRNDVKIKALRRRYGHKGYAVWCFILEALTDGENFEIEFDGMNIELLAADFDVQAEELIEIVDYCCKINLLSISSEHHLYSEAHKRRFSGMLAKRERDRKRLQELSASEREQKESEVIAAENPVSELNNSENAQSKVKETKPKETTEKESKPRRFYPYQAIADKWNEICVSLPKVQRLNDNRRQKIKCRCDEWGKTPEIWLQTAEELFRRIQTSDFLKGSSGSSWTATFDWIFANSSNSIKVMEGNYDNKNGVGVKAAQRNADGMTLGVGEYVDKNGRRTYGTGKATIPPTAPARPSESYFWDEASKSWMNL